MRLSGKIWGFVIGYVLGGPFWAILGLIAGHQHDKNVERAFPRRERFFSFTSVNGEEFLHAMQRDTYMMGVIVLGAKMAKADGSVSRTEIDAFKRVFHIPESEMHQAGRLFDQAREQSGGYEPYAMRLAQVFRHQPMVLEEILSGLFIVAAVDGNPLSPQEAVFLSRVAGLFDFTTSDFVRIAARCGVRLPSSHPSSKEPSTPDAYVVLGVSPSSSNDDIKKAYRMLIRQHHPDKLAAQGLPPELIAQATEKMKRLNAAYDTLCVERGIK